MQITVKVKRSLLRTFAIRAKRVFSDEALAFLIGHQSIYLVEIEELYFPADKLPLCGRRSDSIIMQPQWLLDAKEHAAEAGLDVVGTIHSHPDAWDHSLSEKDLDYSPGWNEISGVCKVIRMRNGKLRASTRFWGPTIPVKVDVR